MSLTFFFRNSGSVRRARRLHAAVRRLHAAGYPQRDGVGPEQRDGLAEGDAQSYKHLRQNARLQRPEVLDATADHQGRRAGEHRAHRERLQRGRPDEGNGTYDEPKIKCQSATKP